MKHEDHLQRYIIFLFSSVRHFCVRLCESVMCGTFYQMSDCICVMFLFVFFHGVLGAEDSLKCKMMGRPEFPLLSQEGDIIIGGAFTLHNQMSKPSLSFGEMPEDLTCSR